MDVFVLPSWREGMPRSAIEAASMARPLVLTDIRGCREVVRHGVEGYLVPVRNPAALAEAIERILSDPSSGERMGMAARARALERFDERRVAATVVQSTAEVLRRKGYSVPTERSMTAEP
jgi:glycosyltransferase involved in cell wall biosynthesis